MARKTGQIVGRGRHRWLVRVFLGRDRETRKRRYHNRTIRGSARHAQTYLNKVLRDRDLGRQVDGVQITLNEYLDRWLETAAKPRLREKSYRSYEGLLRRYVRPSLGARNLAAICPLDVQAAYQELVELVCPLEPSATRILYSVHPCGKQFGGGSWSRIRPTVLSCPDSEGANCGC